MIENSIRDKLLFRAGYKCEYCQRSLIDASWQIEHINPKSNGGTDQPSNLAVACPRCNLNKRESIKGKDFVTGKESRLFNPRKDKWGDHFGVIAGQIVGRSLTGRVTARILFKRSEQQLPPDLCWWPLKGIKDEGLYKFLNHQRARRLGNKFDDLARALKNIPFLEKINDQDFEVAQFAAYLLMAESLYTRSTIEDVRNAFDIVSAAWSMNSLDSVQQAELLNVTSIVLQQLATVLALEGKGKEASSVQKRAFIAFKKKLELTGDADNRNNFRLKSLHNKYISDEAKISLSGLNDVIQEAHEGNPSALSFVADMFIAQNKPHNQAEQVLDEINNLLLSIGYGQDFNYGYNIVVRRRWWLLLASLNLTMDLDLLASDLQFWKSINMQNEIRELSVSLRKMQNQNHKIMINDMLSVVDLYGEVHPQNKVKK